MLYLEAFIFKYATVITSTPGYCAHKNTVSLNGIADKDPILICPDICSPNRCS